MGSRNPPPHSYDRDPKSLEALGQAFDATWVEVQARNPFRDFERDSELKTTISDELSMLAADGVTCILRHNSGPCQEAVPSVEDEHLRVFVRHLRD